MYPHSGRGGPYRWDREEEYIRSRYLNQQHLRAPASGSFSSRATSSDRYYTPHQVEPPVDYRERDLEVSLHMIQNKYQTVKYPLRVYLLLIGFHCRLFQKIT